MGTGSTTGRPPPEGGNVACAPEILAGGPGIYIGSLDSSEIKRLTPADSAGAYAPSGWLLFMRQGVLVAQRFDVTRYLPSFGWLSGTISATAIGTA
jgi:hypothetical protein